MSNRRRGTPTRAHAGAAIRNAILGVGCLVASFGFARAQEPSTPNVVLILADDLGQDDPSVYDPETVSPTPNIDRLAEQGIRFLDANTPSSVCTPTRYAILTGRYAWRTRLARGVLSILAEPLIDRARLTLPELLRDKGYRTAAIGKWHLGMNVPILDGRGFARVEGGAVPLETDFRAAIQDGPLDHGFDTYFGAQLPKVRAFVRDRHFVGEPQPSATGRPLMKPRRSGRERNLVGEPGMNDRPFEVEGWEEAQRGPRQLEAALEFIERCRAEDPTRPFFLYFASQQPHPPFVAADTLAGVPIAGTSPGGSRADCIKELDVTVGELTRRIDELDLARNTLILVTSDNGAPVSGKLFGDEARAEQVGDFRGAKGTVWEAGHRVPFVARWGDGTAKGSTIPPGHVTREIIGLQDVMATLAELVGTALPLDAAEDSESFLDVLRGGLPDRPIREDLVVQGGDGQFAIRQANWKLVVDFDSVAVGSDPTAPLPLSGQLYDLLSDPGEEVDRSAEFPDRVRILAERLNEVRARGSSTRRAEARRVPGGRPD